MTEIEFAKYHGLGNDFVIVEDLQEDTFLSPPEVAAMCDRHHGVGADGLLFVRPSAVADFRMVYHNADGGEAEMCGNGIRCFVKYLHDYRLTCAPSVRVETGAGVLDVEVLTDEGVAVGASVLMGSPDSSPDRIPVLLDVPEAVDVVLSTSRGDVHATCLSLGNPHCVLFGPDVASAPVASLGSELEHSALFPRGVNVEFVQVVAPGRLKARVWERGVGETLACGTGACAAAVAAIRLGLVAGPAVAVELPGGVLDIHWEPGEPVRMSGPAEHVFTGTYFLVATARPH
jgi:diaminopimelate epimerase